VLYTILGIERLRQKAIQENQNATTPLVQVFIRVTHKLKKGISLHGRIRFLGNTSNGLNLIKSIAFNWIISRNLTKNQL